MRARVLAAARELGYQPNAMASGLITKEFSPLIGQEEIDLYSDFGSKVMATNSAYNFGLSPEQAIAIRDLLARILMQRVPGQVGRSTPENQ